MPSLNETKYPQSSLIADINDGKSFVKVVPENIGDLIYFDSDEPRAEPLADSVYATRKIITAIISIALIAVIWYFLTSVGWQIVLSLAILFFGGLIFLGQGFGGDDYFVGTEGFAKYHFSKNRENVDSKEEHRYDDGFLLVHHEVKQYKNGSYDRTEFSFTYIGKPNQEGIASTIAEEYGSYDCEEGGNNTGEADYDYWCRIEDEITSKYLIAAQNLLDAGHSVPIFVTLKQNDNTWKTGAVIHLAPGVIKYGDKTYTQEDLKRVYIDKGVVYLEDNNYSSKLMGLKKTGEKIALPLEMIGNRKAFIILLSKLYGIQ